MPSQKQLDANRLNAQLSTGPRTPEGKAIARLNAVQHALTGQLTIVAPHQHDAFLALSGRLTASLNPAGEQELQVAARIVRDTWRLARAAANEENVYALGLMEHHDADEHARDIVQIHTAELDTNPVMTSALSDARIYFNKIRDFDRASLYEQRLRRGLLSDYKLFHQLQKDRISLEIKVETKPRPARKAQTAAANGSVLSTPPTALFAVPLDRKIEPQPPSSASSPAFTEPRT
jgi:hypothetical protein